MARYSLAVLLLLYGCVEPAPTAEELMIPKPVKRDYFRECMKAYDADRVNVEVYIRGVNVRGICFNYAQHMRRMYE